MNDTFEFSFPQDREIRDVMSQPGQVKQSIKEAWATSALHEEKERLEQRNKKQSTVKRHSTQRRKCSSNHTESGASRKFESTLGARKCAAQLLKYEAKEHIKAAGKQLIRCRRGRSGREPRPGKVVVLEKLGIRLRNKSAAAYHLWKSEV